MSCITIVGRTKRWNAACDVPLPRTAPEWSKSKARRLAQFAVSDRASLRAIAAAHPRIPQAALMLLIMDESSDVRRAAVKNPTMTDHMLHLALSDADLGIAAYARLISEENTDA